MNPYPQYMFSQSPQGYLPYNQTAYQQYPTQKSAVTIEQMYTTVHPYNNQQFLLRTFGNKTQYIKVFLTLSHEDKLKMYMLMEENKIYGYMTDKDSYQRILKEIAQKVHNYNLFYQKTQQKSNNKEDAKSKDLQNKIDLIVEKTFEKLNLSNLNNHNAEKRTDKEQLVLSQNDDEQEQWVESTQPELVPQVQSKTNNQTIGPSIPQNKSIEQRKQQQQVFNMFTFDSNIEEALTHNIGLKTVAELQKKSIWELQLEDYQLMGNQPNLKEVFGINQSNKSNEIKKEEANLQSQTLFSLSNNNEVLSYENYQNQAAEFKQMSIFPTNSYELYHQNQTNRIKQQFKIPLPQIIPENYQFQNNKENINYQQVEQAAYKSNTKIQNIQLGLQYLENKIQIVSNSTAQQQNENVLINNNQSQQKQQNQKINNATQNLRADDLLNNHFDISNNQNQGQALKQQKNQQKISQKQIINDFDLFGVFSSQMQAVQPKALIVVPQELIEEKENTFNLGNNYNFSIINSPVIQQSRQPQPLRSDVITQTLFHHDENKEEIIRDLRIQLNQKEKQMITKQLKNKSFECSTDFYLTIINYLREVSLEQSPQYIHFNQQYKIVKEILEESQRYTRAVDQDEEENVQKSVKRTKQLLNIIYKNSNQTQQYVKSILSETNKEKGLLFKFGRVLINSAISPEILSKAASQSNKKVVFNSFFLLFLLQKLSSTQKIKKYSQDIVAYLQQQYQKHRNLNQSMITQIQQNIQNYPQYLIYLRGLLKLCTLCQRMISLIKTCYIKTQANMVKTLKICKDVKTKYSDFIEQSKDSTNSLQMYEESIKKGIQRNKSVYELHSDFFMSYQVNPICGICLRLIQKKGNQIDNIYYHFSCFNLVSYLQKNALPINQ